MAKTPTKKISKTPKAALLLVVMKKDGNGKKMRGKCEDDMEEYRKGGLIKKKKGCK